MEETGKLKGTLERRKTSRWWYGSYRIDGKRRAVNLHVEIRGQAPQEGEEHGSIQFEKSRTEAEVALKRHLEEINSNHKAEELAQAVHVARTGRKVTVYQLADLPSLWETMPRNKPVTTQHAKKCLSKICVFLDWIENNHPAATKLDHLSPEIAKSYMKWQENRGIAPRTWNLNLIVLKSACRRGGCTAFDDIRQKPQESVHRIPFSPEELADVIEASRSDELIYPLVVTAACTAMRKGDCCRLKWEDVDLDKGFISVKTSKTGRTVDIPLADLLREEINQQNGNGSEYVFPELEAQYKADDALLTKRFKRILHRVGFHDGTPQTQQPIEFDPEELTLKAERYFVTIPTQEKQKRARTVFEIYISGKSLSKSAELAGVSKGSASAYLNAIEESAGINFIRGKKQPPALLPPSRGQTVQERTVGLRKASVRDFHALRTTWITLALMQGLPLELVQTVTGHATAEIVMQHYFKPQREQLKAAMNKHMPSLLTCSSSPFQYAPLPEWAREKIMNMTAANMEEVRTELLNRNMPPEPLERQDCETKGNQ